MSECCCCRADTASLSTRRSVECVWVLERQRGKRQVAVNAESSSSGPYLSPPSSSNYTCSFLLFFLSFFFVGGAKKLASFRPAAFERSNAGLDDEGGDHRWRWWKKVMLCVAVLCSLRMAVRRDSQKPFNDPAAAADHEEEEEQSQKKWKKMSGNRSSESSSQVKKKNLFSFSVSAFTYNSSLWMPAIISLSLFHPAGQLGSLLLLST